MTTDENVGGHDARAWQDAPSYHLLPESIKLAANPGPEYLLLRDDFPEQTLLG